MHPLPATAGAWTRPEGNLQVITTALAYQTDRRFDNNGTSVPQPRYRKQEINPYIEYGLRDGLTVGANLFLQRLDDSTNTTTGLGDTELFLRTRLWERGSTILSFQPEVKLPSPHASAHSPAIGSAHVDTGARLLGGRHFEWLGRSHYAEAELGYRLRGGESGNQVLAKATVGLSVASDLLLLPQVAQTWRTQSPAMPGFTQSPRDDYSLTRLQLSAVYRLSDTQAVQAGVFRHVEGRNAGAGGGALIAWWQEF